MSSPQQNGKNKSKSKASGAQMAKSNNGSNKNRNNTRKNNPQQVVAVAYAKPFKSVQPKIRATEKFVRIIHREPVAIITQPGTAFTVQQFLPINPGMQSTFKWLSLQAIGWEKYQFEKLEFEYYSRVPTSFGGSIQLAIDHDPADVPPSTEDVLMNYSGAIEDVIWVKSMTAKAICDNSKRFIRSGPLAANLDIKTYDLGNFIAATSGVGSSATNAGKIYVSYVVKMFIPQLPSILFGPAGGTFIGTVGTTPAIPFGTAPVAQPNLVGATLSSASRLTLDNVGQYLATVTATGTGLTLPNPTLVSGSGSVTDSGSVINATGDLAQLKSVLNVLTQGTVFDYDFTGSSTITGAHLDFARSPPNSIV